MYTYQDFENEKDKITGVINAISHHKNSELYKTAISADNYDHQKNELIMNYVKMIFTLTGTPVRDFTASNNKLCSNFFHRLNTQRNTYLLGNGVSFTDHKEEIEQEDGSVTTVDKTKETLGKKFDNYLQQAGYFALIHGVTFGYWNVDELKVFPVTNFAPLWDESSGLLRAGVRFWQIDENKPMYVELYEEEGVTYYRSKINKEAGLEEIGPTEKYVKDYEYSQEGGEVLTGEHNYTKLPIIPFWGSKLKQSTLVGMKEKIDSFDLIRSGFANDLTDCAQIYWIIENCGGMTDEELGRFRDRLKINHIAVADTQNSKVSPYTQDIPYAARKEYLDEIRSGIYEDFGGLDVHAVDAASTNDHLEAAYQPLDEEADDFEYQVLEFLEQLLDLLDIEDTPIFKRNRISNQKEQTDMILSAADYLDEETILNKLPFVTVDEIAKILANKDEENNSRFEDEGEEDLDIEDDELLEEEEEEDDIDAQLESLLAEL